MASPGMFMIADSHVRKENASAFFRMLEKISKTDDNLVFLGDILDPWIALPGYENDINQQFLNWCKEEQKHRQLIFVEGNYDFFVARCKKDCFTICTETTYLDEQREIIFIHGDQLPDIAWHRRFFPKLLKSRAGYVFFRIPFLGRFAISVYMRLKERQRKTKWEKECKVPIVVLESFAEKQDSNKIKRIFTGHFHRSFRGTANNGIELNVVPSWRMDGKKLGYLSSDGNYQTLEM